MHKKIKNILLSSLACITPASAIFTSSYQTNELIDISTIFSSPKIEKMLGLNDKPTTDEVLGYLHKYLVDNNKFTQYGTLLNEINVQINDVIIITTNSHSSRYAGSFQLEYDTFYEPTTVSEIFTGFTIPNLYYVPSLSEIKKMLADYLIAQSRTEYINLINYMNITIGGTAGNLKVTLDAFNTPYFYISGQASFNYSLKTPSEFYRYTDTAITGFSDEFMNNQAKYNMYSIMEIPANVTSIAAYAFWKNSTSIIPEFITELSFGKGSNCSAIKNQAFMDALSFTSLDFSNATDLSSIGLSAFRNCSSLTSISLSTNLTFIDGSAFRNCSLLTSVDLSICTNLTVLNNAIFFDCSSLTSISLPSGLTTIGGSVFEKCSSLTSITFPSSLSTINIYAFKNCSNLSTITWDAWNGNTSLQNSSFSSVCLDGGTVTVTNPIDDAHNSAALLDTLKQQAGLPEGWSAAN